MAGPEPLEGGAVTSISLARGAGYGTCPVYRMPLSKTGRATYVGKDFVERVGRWRGTIDPDWFDDLVRVILRLGFSNFEPIYGAFETDMPRES